MNLKSSFTKVSSFKINFQLIQLFYRLQQIEFLCFYSDILVSHGVINTAASAP
jgi:hypothetical protein